VFYDINDKMISQIRDGGCAYSPIQDLKENEEIIGIYGNSRPNNGANYFANHGFIVWTPPKF